MWALLTVWPLVSAADAAVAQPAIEAPTVSARIDRPSARVGDPISLQVVAIRKRGVVCNLQAGPQLGKLAVLDRSEADQDLGDGSARKEWTLRVAAYETGPFEVPALVVTYLGPSGEVREVRTARLAGTVEALTGPEDRELREVSSPVRVMSENRLPLYLVGGWVCLGLTVAIGFAIRRRVIRRREAARLPPPRPAHEVARERLDALLAAFDLQTSDRKPMFLAMSEILRDCLRARLGVLPTTTTELERGLLAHVGTELDEERYAAIVAWMRACDLVKFAQYPATEDDTLAAAEELSLILAQLAPSLQLSAEVAA